MLNSFPLETGTLLARGRCNTTTSSLSGSHPNNIVLQAMLPYQHLQQHTALPRLPRSLSRIGRPHPPVNLTNNSEEQVQLLIKEGCDLPRYLLLVPHHRVHNCIPSAHTKSLTSQHCCSNVMFKPILPAGSQHLEDGTTVLASGVHEMVNQSVQCNLFVYAHRGQRQQLPQEHNTYTVNTSRYSRILFLQSDTETTISIHYSSVHRKGF